MNNGKKRRRFEVSYYLQDIKELQKIAFFVDTEQQATDLVVSAGVQLKLEVYIVRVEDKGFH